MNKLEIVILPSYIYLTQPDSALWKAHEIIRWRVSADARAKAHCLTEGELGALTRIRIRHYMRDIMEEL